MFGSSRTAITTLICLVLTLTVVTSAPTPDSDACTDGFIRYQCATSNSYYDSDCGQGIITCATGLVSLYCGPTNSPCIGSTDTCPTGDSNSLATGGLAVQQDTAVVGSEVTGVARSTWTSSAGVTTGGITSSQDGSSVVSSAASLTTSVLSSVEAAAQDLSLTSTTDPGLGTSGGPFTRGWATYFDPGTGYCGYTEEVGTYYAALLHIRTNHWPGFAAVLTGGDTNPNNNPYCTTGKDLADGFHHVKASFRDRSITLIMVDRCAACDTDDIDMSRAAFEYLFQDIVGENGQGNGGYPYGKIPDNMPADMKDLPENVFSWEFID